MASQHCFIHCRIAVPIFLIALLLAGCRETKRRPGIEAATNTAAMHSYSTSFPRVENPIREGRNWVGGSDGGTNFWLGSLFEGGLLWGNVQTTSGFAYGVSEPTEFGDPTAIVSGVWGPDQTATARVKINKVPIGHCCHEVELRLRTTISPNSITGYEAYCSVMPDNQYCHIARWNGPNGSYWNFETGSADTYAADGDTLTATVKGTNPVVITLYKNDKQILQATDQGAAGGGFGSYGPWTSGNPGIGFYDNHDKHWETFGFSSFSATDESSGRSNDSKTGKVNPPASQPAD